MKKLFLIRNPDLLQGKKYLNKNKNYFEGWYFKNTNGKDTISFIPGISINKSSKKAFIQIITNNNSYFINYDIKKFKYNHNPFYIKIGNNLFSKDSISININSKKDNLKITGNIRYFNNINIKSSLLSPNIMGPFSYIPFMECNHAILSMKSSNSGFININNNKLDFNNGNSYIEKDWGQSFPKSYIWLQGNNFKNKNISFMLSIADIPLKIFNFRGIICVLIVNDIEYRFTTYNNTKLIKYDISDKEINITLKKKNYFLNIRSVPDNNNKLLAPVKGKMEKDILESISSKIFITLKKKNKIIFKDTSINCGLEIVNE